MSTNILPSQYAQSVQPNPKCEGCLHYDAQRGPTGVCLIGLKPWICGPGDAPNIGYAPLASAQPYLPGSPVEPAQAGASGSDQASVAITETVLGDNQIDVVKGLIAEREALMKSACPLHAQHVPYSGQFALHSQVEQPCLCNPVTDYEIAKALVPLLTNAEREYVTAQELVTFVSGVRKGFDRAQLLKPYGDRAKAPPKPAPGRTKTLADAATTKPSRQAMARAWQKSRAALTKGGSKTSDLKMAKGGAGSRGGKVIGTTRGGHPIYGPSRAHIAGESGAEDKHHTKQDHYKDWSSKDHLDAATEHSLIAQRSWHAKGAGEKRAHQHLAGFHTHEANKPRED